MKIDIKLAFVIGVIFVVATFVMAGAAVAKESKLNVTDNISEAQQIAADQNKDIFLVLTSDTCYWCEKLEQATLSDEKVIETLNEKYVTVVIPVEKQPEIAEAFNAIGTPIMILMDSNGTEQERLNGYYGPEELLEYL